MNYKVVPFNAGMKKGEGTAKAASQLEALINQHAGDGWRYRGLETLQTVVTTPAVAAVPGTNGCMGLGATPGTPGIPERRNMIEVYVAVFESAAS